MLAETLIRGRVDKEGLYTDAYPRSISYYPRGVMQSIIRRERKVYLMNLLNLFMGTLGSDDSINSLAKKTGVNASLMTKLLPLAIPILLKALTKNL